jgi:hypothetical protein
MNAERLHAIVDALRGEIEATHYPEHLEQLVSGLRAAVDAPNQPGPQEEISAARESLKVALSEASSNDFSPAWEQEIGELGIADLFGDSLLQEIESILLTNEITPKTAAEEISDIQNRVNALVAALDQAAASLTFFRIGSEDLLPGEFEIGFMIPRKEVDNGLAALGKEFGELKQIVDPFSELGGENRPEIEVRSISSSEFQVFLLTAGPVAASFAYAFDKLISAYERIVHIRLMNKELAEKDSVPDEVLQPLSAYASDLIKKEIEEIVEGVISRSKLADEGRLNELRTDLAIQLSALAERIDHGYNVEVRTGELPEPAEDDDEEPFDSETRQAVKVVMEAQRNIRYMNSTGKAILSLDAPAASGTPSASSSDGGSSGG